MRLSAVVLASLLAVAAAHPHTPPLHNRHNGLARRAGNDTEEAVPSDTPSPTSKVEPTSTTTTTKETSTEKPAETSKTTTTTSTTDDAKASTPAPTSTSHRTTTSQTQAIASSDAQDTSSTESTSQSSTSAQQSASSTADASSSSATQTGASAVGSPLTQAPTKSSSSSTSEELVTMTSTNSLGRPVIVSTKAVKPSSSASKASSEDDKKSGGLSKGALIGIIIAAVVGGAAIIWTLFRKWKLRPSNRFDERMKPIDFSPNNDRDMNDDFIEKTLQRSASVTSADRQRQQFVADLDHPNGPHSLTAGVPEHDFTAGSGAATYNHYDPDPYEYDAYGRPAANNNYDFSSPRADGHPDIHSDHGHAQYDAAAQYGDYPAMPEPSHAMYPPQQPGVPAPTGGYYSSNDYPTQDHVNASHDDGYSNLQRGPSVGHAQVPYPPPQSTPFDPLGGNDFSIAGRPTGGADAGPYAQAAAFRY